MLLRRPDKVVYFSEVSSLEFLKKEGGIDVAINSEVHTLFRTGRPASLKCKIELFVHDLGVEPNLREFLTFTSDCDQKWRDLFIQMSQSNLHELKKVFHEVGKPAIKK